MNARETSPRRKGSKLVQSTLPSAYLLPYKKYPSGDSNREPPNAKPINLHPERRANLQFKSPPLPTQQSTLLAQVAAETKAILPNLLKLTPNAPPNGYLYLPNNFPHLDPRYCPHLLPNRVTVMNSDTLDAALSLHTSRKPVCVLNMANAEHGGGGWLKGALAQEEAMCYRSSLSFTLKRRFYPLPECGGIYSPSVVVIRDNLSRGHQLLDLKKPQDLGVVSCVSIAAVRDPDLVLDKDGKQRYKHGSDPELMKEKLRVVLRIAALNGHRSLVLGALGCGAFGHPRWEVVKCWKEVFDEGEFSGGWWEKVVFAVLETHGTKDGDDNFGVFFRGLNGVFV